MLQKRIKNLLKKLSIFSFITVFVLGISACGIIPKEEDTLAPPLVEPPKITYDELEVKRGSIEITVNDRAAFQSVKLSNEFFKYNVGYLKDIKVQLGDKVKAGTILAEQETEDLELDFEKKQLSLKMDQLTYDKIQNEVNSAPDDKTKSDLKIQLEQQNIKLQLDKLDVEQAKKEIGRSTLTSSISGTVVYVDTLNPGDKITTYKTVVTVADPKNLQLQYSGNSVDKFDMGAVVNVKFNNKDYSGTVVMNPSSVPADGNKDAKKVVMIKLPSVPSDAQIGDSADISLTLQKKDDVIVIPRNCVHNGDNENYVEMLDNGLRVQRNVELGIQNATDVEIVKGLNEGEKILK